MARRPPTLAAGVFLVALLQAPGVRAHTPPPFLAALSLGGTVGEYRGPTLDLELDFGGRGQYFGLILEGGGGYNSDRNGVAMTGVSLGWRGMFGSARVKPIVFLGAFSSFEHEFEGDRSYQYALGGGRASAGVSFFVNRRFSIGGELGGTAGYRYQLSGPFADYSGFASSFEGRLRMTF